MPHRRPAATMHRMFSGLESPLHLLILLFLLLVLFGAKRLPEMGRSLGTGMREFKDSLTRPSAESTAAVAPPAGEQNGDGH